MSRIHSNVPAMKAVHRLDANQSDLNLRLERLATGLKINRGADDPAGLIASERLRFEIRGIQQAIENSGRAANVIMTTEGALQEVSALLLDLQELIVESSNSGGLLDEEVRANQLQIDSILTSIDRIANTTTFAGRKLIDGSQGYLVSGVSPGAIASLSIFSAKMPPGVKRDVQVQVVQSAQAARIALIGAQAGAASTTSATTISLRGNLGVELLSFASGTSLSDVRAAINNITAITGVSATVSTPGAGTVRSALILSSIEFGSDAFVSVTPLAGNFVAAGTAPAGRELYDTGQDVGVLIDGLRAEGDGLRAEVRAPTLDMRLYLNATFAQRLSAASFTITGGGTHFQLTPEISTAGQVHMAFNSVSTSNLGNPVVGLLHSLRSGFDNALEKKEFQAAQSIVNEAISQVASYRGRLGSIHKNQVEANIAAQGVALENVTASESIIRDAEIAVEVSALTRAQILVQSTQMTLQIANSQPREVLSLLT